MCLFPIAMLLVSPLTYLHHVFHLSISAIVWIPTLIRRKAWLALCGCILALATAGVDWPLLYDRLGPTFRRPAIQAINLYAIAALFVMILVAFEKDALALRERAVPCPTGD